MKKTALRVCFFATGMMILSFGVSLIILSGAGTGAWDVLFVGVSNHTALSVGKSIFVVQFLVLLVNAVFQQTRPAWWSMGAVVVNGACVDLFLLYILKNFQPDTFIIISLSFGSGLVLLALGISLYLQAKFVTAPIDQLMLILHTKFSFSYGLSRFISEACAFIIGFLIGGPAGIGTLVMILVFPFVLQYCMKAAERLYQQAEFAFLFPPSNNKTDIL